MPTPTAAVTAWRTEFCARLRAARGIRSLRQIEQDSHRQFLAVVIGSYERGDRNPSMTKLAEYAAFLGVPTVTLIPNLNPGREAMYGGTW